MNEREMAKAIGLEAPEVDSQSGFRPPSAMGFVSITPNQCKAISKLLGAPSEKTREQIELEAVTMKDDLSESLKQENNPALRVQLEKESQERLKAAQARFKAEQK